MPQHGLTVVRDQNSIPLRRERKNIRIGNSFELCLISRLKIQPGLSTPAPFHDRVI